MEPLRWRWYELKRLYRLWLKTEASADRLIKVVGPLWLWRHGAKREFKVYPWSNRREWYAIDIAIPHKKVGVEADGWSHKGRESRDILRDQRLGEKGWEILRIDDSEVRESPRKVRRRVRRFLLL